jgi:hypothetical protein
MDFGGCAIRTGHIPDWTVYLLDANSNIRNWACVSLACSDIKFQDIPFNSSSSPSHHKYMSCTPTVEIFYTRLFKIEHVRADRRHQQTSFSLQTLQARSSFQPILICPVYVSLYNNYTNTKKPYPTTNLHTNTPHRTNKNHMQANPTLKQHARNQKVNQ